MNISWSIVRARGCEGAAVALGRGAASAARERGARVLSAALSRPDVSNSASLKSMSMTYSKLVPPWELRLFGKCASGKQRRCRDMSLPAGLSGSCDELAMHRQQILPVAALRCPLRQPVELIGIDVTQPQRDLLDAGDAQALALLEDLHEVAGFDQRLVRAGVEPGKAAAEHLDMQVAAFEIGAVDVGDLELAARRRLQRCRDLEHIVIVEIEAGRGDVGFRLRRLLL